MSAEHLERVAAPRDQLLALLRSAEPRQVDAAVEDAIRRSGRIIPTGPRYHLTARRKCWLHWTWRIADDSVSPHRVVAFGWAWSERRMQARRERAHLELLDGAA